MHEGEGSAREISNDITGYVRRSEIPGKKQCRINGHDPSGRRATSRIFPEPLPFRHDYGYVGPRDKGYIPVVHVYADDIVLCGTRSEVVEKKLEEWRRAMEDRGLKINRKKTVYLRFNVDRDLDDGTSDVNIQGENLEQVNTFKYLGATLAENGDLDAEMTHRIQSGWKNWKRISGILCDRRISLRVKGKVYKTVVRPAMMCRDVGSEESTREEVGCGGNEDVKMDGWSHQDGQN